MKCQSYLKIIFNFILDKYKNYIFSTFVIPYFFNNLAHISQGSADSIFPYLYRPIYILQFFNKDLFFNLRIASLSA